MHVVISVFLIQSLLGHAGFGEDTIVSVLEAGSMIDIRLVPDRLSRAGVPSVGELSRVSRFLFTTPIKTLRFIKCQIAPTSVDSVSSADLCRYLHLAENYLPNTSVTCQPDTELEELGNRQKARSVLREAKLYVNDPKARHQTHLERMQMPAVWDLIKRYPRKNVTVAVIDGGIDFTDPDMAPLRTSSTLTNGTVIDGGWNFVNDSSELHPGGYHGQYISRVAAARGNNSYGMIGVMPDHVNLVSLQVFYNGQGRLGKRLEAINMAVDIGVDVILMASGIDRGHHDLPPVDLLARALEKSAMHGVVTVFAAGNANKVVNTYLSSYEGPNSICVTSLNNEGIGLPRFANYGRQVALAAFGENIYVGLDATGKDHWDSGTSYSAPMVAGAAAILLSIGVEPSNVKTLLLAGSDHVDTGDKYLHPDAGALNILASVEKVIRMYNLSPIIG